MKVAHRWLSGDILNWPRWDEVSQMELGYALYQPPTPYFNKMNELQVFTFVGSIVTR